MTAAAIEVQSVSKSYADETVLDGIDLAVPEGEFCVVLGPSGCGKTTLLDCIAGLSGVDSGRVAYFGEDVTGHCPPVTADGYESVYGWAVPFESDPGRSLEPEDAP